MQYRKLGRSDLQVSEVGFGCMSLQGSDAVNAALLQKAMDAGINYFDTADVYDKGANETTVGKALKGKRKDVIIATKVGNQWRPDGSGFDWNPGKKYILSSVEESLRRLQTDYIDLYQLHGGTIDDPIDETISAFDTLIQQGKIRYYGISSIRPNVIREWVTKSSMVSVMMQYSLLDRRPEETCFSLLQENGISVLARGSLAKGLLVDKPATDYLNYSSDQVEKMARAVNSISDGMRNAVQTNIQYVLSHPVIASAVVGIRTLKQLETATQAGAVNLSLSELDFLDNILRKNYYTEHR